MTMAEEKLVANPNITGAIRWSEMQGRRYRLANCMAVVDPPIKY